MPRPDGQSCWAPIPNQMILAQLIRFDWTPIHCLSILEQCTTTTQCPQLLCCPSCTNNEPQTDQVVISPHLRTCYNPITEAAPSRALLFHSCWVIPMWNKILISDTGAMWKSGHTKSSWSSSSREESKTTTSQCSLPWPEHQIVGPPRQQAMTLATRRRRERLLFNYDF